MIGQFLKNNKSLQGMKQNLGWMKGKRGVIMGVANHLSIAWGIAEQLAAQGAELAFSYQGETLEKRVRPLAEPLGTCPVFPCDVLKDEDIASFFEEIQKLWGKIDSVVHAIAFSDKEELNGLYLTTTRENFLNTMNISCYSFTAVARHAQPLLSEGSSLLTMTYVGAERVMPHYNVMGVAKAALEASVRYLAVDLGSQGIRVNGLSAGTIKILASSGIGDFRYILKWNQYNSPLRRNITLNDVGSAAFYLLSDLSSGVTGEIHHVDGGYNIVGMKAIDAPDITTV